MHVDTVEDRVQQAHKVIDAIWASYQVEGDNAGIKGIGTVRAGLHLQAHCHPRTESYTSICALKPKVR